MSLSARAALVYLPNLSSAVKFFQSSCAKYSVAAAALAHPVSQPLNLASRTPAYEMAAVRPEIGSSALSTPATIHIVSSVKSASVAETNSVEDSAPFLPADVAHCEVGTVELTATSVGEKMARELAPLFPDRDLTASGLTAVTVCLRTELSMAEWSVEMEAERESLLETYIQSGIAICEALRSNGFWADFIDPSCGKPYLSKANTNTTLFETDYRMGRLSGGRLSVNDLGCCRVVEHVEWGVHAYVGVVFTDAPRDHPLLARMTPA